MKLRDNEYYVLTSKDFEKIELTKELNDCFEFIKKYKDTKVRKMDFRAVPRIIRADLFLITFYEQTKEAYKLFVLMDIMIKKDDCRLGLVRNLGLMKLYSLREQIKEPH